MRTLLSTRLFSLRPLDRVALATALEAGFPTLQLHAAPGHFDPLERGEPEHVAELLATMGMEAPWMHLDPDFLTRLVQLDAEQRQQWLRALRILRVDTLSLPKRPWTGAGRRWPRLRELGLWAQEAGARLVLDVAFGNERILRHLPADVAICWDLCWPATDPTQEEEEADVLLRHLGSRLWAVRVAHGEGDRRQAPGRREANLLTQAWRLQPPRVLVYDVEERRTFVSPAEWRGTLERILHFHSGGDRPPHQGGGGLFWAGLAPG